MRLVREPPKSPDETLDEQIKKDVEATANQTLFEEEDKVSVSFQEVKNSKDYFFPKMEI